MGPPGSMKTYGLRGASQEKGQKKITVRKEFPVFDKLFAKENKDLSSKKKEKGLWDESLDLFDLKAKGRKPLKVVNNLLNSTEGSLFSSANDTFDNFCSDGKFNQKVTDKVPSGVSIEISGHEQGSKNLVVHNSSENDSSLLCQSMFKHSLKNPPMQPVTEKKAWSNPWNESEALLISKNENCSDLMKHSSEVLVDSRKESEQVNDKLDYMKEISCSDQVFKFTNLPTLEKNEAEDMCTGEMKTPLSALPLKKGKQRKRTNKCQSVDLMFQLRRNILTSTPSSHCLSSHLSSKDPFGSLLEGVLSPVPKDLLDDVFVSSPELSEQASIPFEKISRNSSSGTKYESAVTSQSLYEPVKEQYSSTSKSRTSLVREERRDQLHSDINEKASNCLLADINESGSSDVQNGSVDLFGSLGSEKEITKVSEYSKKSKDSVSEKNQLHDNFEVSAVLRNFTRRRRCSLRTLMQDGRKNSSKGVELQVNKRNSRCSRAYGRQSSNKSLRNSRPFFNCNKIRNSSICKKGRSIQEVSTASILSNNSKLQVSRSREQHQIEKRFSNQGISQKNNKSQKKRLKCNNVLTYQRFTNVHYLKSQEAINDVSIEDKKWFSGFLNEDSNTRENHIGSGNETSVWSSALCDAKQIPSHTTSTEHEDPETVSSNLLRADSTNSVSSSSKEELLENDVFATSHLYARSSGNSSSVLHRSDSLTKTKGNEMRPVMYSQAKLFTDKYAYDMCKRTGAKYSVENEIMPARSSVASVTQAMADLQVQDQFRMLPNIHGTKVKLSDFHPSAPMPHNRRQTLPWKSHLLLANRQRLNTSRRCGERRSSRKSVSQIGALPGKSVSKAVLDPKQHVLELCGQKNPVSIQECLTSSRLKCCKKIGEGAFGEVFMTRPDPNSMDGAAVLKIMPIEGNFKVNGENQKTFGEIVSEIIISKELSGLRESNEGRNCCENFVHVLSSWCVFGSYLPSLLDMWDQFDTEKGSENDRPDLFPDTQLYIILEFGHGGQDLESFVFNNAGQAVAIFLQIAYSLAVSEQELEFEHRDLHWGNVLVAVSSAKVMEFRIAGKTYKLKTQGVKATVIDFTLSRLQAPDCVVFNNLSQDPELFESEGDYQFEVYRLMKKATKNDWEKFNPYTNVLWLHYILDKMETECYYKNVKTKVHQTNLKEIRQLKSSMLDYRSATDFVLKREE
ncbi:haspin isoform X1 [Oratosquilla oratoria]|uniref:haspin isoform X1 n=1 Tax=Oratosquilla oratoria TaxID=337810 RepID=UPI003F770BCE